MILMLLLLPLLSFANPPAHWSAVTSISDRHEFYKNNEVILKPADTWQTLFAVIYPDRSLNLNKDCIYYRVPGSVSGVFKVVKVAKDRPCDKAVEEKPILELKDLKALQFAITDNEMSFYITQSDYRVSNWTFPLTSKPAEIKPKEALSSAEYKASKMIFLAPFSAPEGTPNLPSEEKKCHDINDDCSEISVSSCHLCSQGWYEAPNGCPQGPKYCGLKGCGGKNQPACRRGMKYQRMRKKFECRLDPSFAYCNPDLSIQCVGAEAWCR
jgi:hypothetical protein